MLFDREESELSSCDTVSTVSTTYSKRSSSLSSELTSTPRSCMTVRTLEESLHGIDGDDGDGADEQEESSCSSVGSAETEAADRRTRAALSFHTHLTFRRFPLEVADYPEITAGPALGIGWEPLGPDESVDFDEHESAKPEEKKTHRELRCVVFQRWNKLVDAGYTRKEIEVAMKKIERMRKHDFTASCSDDGKKKKSVLGGIKSSVIIKGRGKQQGRTAGGEAADEKGQASADDKVFSKGLNRSFSKRLDRSFSKRLGKKSGNDRSVTTSQKGSGSSPSKPRRGKRGSVVRGKDEETTKGAASTSSPPRRGRFGSVHTGNTFAQRCHSKMRDAAATKVAAPSPQQQ